MSKSLKPPSKAKSIKPANHLKQKVGSGGIPEERIKKAQKSIDDTPVDFKPDAQLFISKLDENLKECMALDAKNQIFEKDLLIWPMMQLKANGGMFKYPLISDVADIGLQFLENVDHYNEETFQVVAAHLQALKSIIGAGLKGDGGAAGQKLVDELHQACLRYFKKYDI